MGVLSVFNAVLAVVGVLLLAYWCSRALGRQWGMNASSGHMKVLDQLLVGQDKRILLLRVGERNYLVGVSSAGIRLLTEVEGDFEADMPPGGRGDTALFSRNFQHFHSFKEALDRLKKPGAEKDL